MPLQARLVWSSRESIAAQLVALLKSEPRESVDLRFRALSLLDIFGSNEQIPFLRELAFDPLEHYRIRVNALRVATKYGLTLSGREFVQLSGDPAYGMSVISGLRMMFDIARLESLDDALKEELLQLSPRKRSSILSLSGHVPQPPELEAWLFEQWYQTDRHLLVAPDSDIPEGAMRNVNIALAHRERPEAWHLLCEWSEGLSDEQWEELLGRRSGPSREEVARLANASRALHRFAARRLLLPLAALRAHWGDEELLRRLDRVIQAAHVASIVPHSMVAPPRFFSQAVELLGEWEVARHRVLYRRLCDFNLAQAVRFHLYQQLRTRDPAVAARWALVASHYPENTELLQRILDRPLSHTPVPEDRPVLLAALRETEEREQSLALSGLLSLGESGPGWVDRLQSLSHAESPHVRVLALAGLVQQGQREWLEPLRRMAVDDSDQSGRRTALEWLAKLDAEVSGPLFANLLLKEVSEQDANPREKRSLLSHPALEALSRRGTAEDLSLLLEARLGGYFTQHVDKHFRHHLARQEGEPVADWPPRKTSDSWCEECLMYEE
ncbi:hypothetical protein JGU66_27745 [Myxococcaceae bacterium JPH2]|nr:hypothetical protein [Myxococcaceae bacterium JPH2]